MPGEGTGASPSSSGLVSPRTLSASTAPIAQSLKGLFQRQHIPPVPLPTGRLLGSRRNSSEQSPEPGAEQQTPIGSAVAVCATKEALAPQKRVS